MLLWSEAFMLKLWCFEVETTSVAGMRQEVTGDTEQAGRVERLMWGSRETSSWCWIHSAPFVMYTEAHAVSNT